MKRQQGFSLIEILVVLGLVAVIFTIGLARPKNQQKAYKRFFRQLSFMSKEIKTRAKIEGSTYRMVFYLQNEKSPEISVEKNEKDFLLGSEKESKELLEELLKEKRKPKQKKKSKKKLKKVTRSFDGFRKSKKFKPKKLRMPQNLRIKQIEVSGLPETVEPEGIGLFYYFGQGLVEEAALQIETTNKQLKWTLVSDPLTGEFHVYGGHKSLKQVRRN